MSAGFLLIHAKPTRTWSAVLSWFLFLAGIAAYLWVSGARHRENPEDRVTPTIAQMGSGMYNAIMQPAEEDETGPVEGGFWAKLSHSMLWKDTLATSRRFVYSLVLLIPAVLLGLHMGLFSYV